MCRPTGSVIGPLHVGPVWLLTHFAYVLVSGASSGFSEHSDGCYASLTFLKT